MYGDPSPNGRGSGATITTPTMGVAMTQQGAVSAGSYSSQRALLREALTAVSTTILNERHPNLAGRMKVKVHFRPRFHFKVHRAPGGVSIHLYVHFENSMAPDFGKLVAKAGVAAMELLATSTHAVAIGSEP